MPALPAPKATYLGHAELVTVTSDENGWEMWITTDQGTYGCNIHGVTKDLMSGALKLADYWAEGRAAAAEHQRDRAFGGDDGDAYPLNDPKSPGYHDRMSAIHDNREKS